MTQSEIKHTSKRKLLEECNKVDKTKKKTMVIDEKDIIVDREYRRNLLKYDGSN